MIASAALAASAVPAASQASSLKTFKGSAANYAHGAAREARGRVDVAVALRWRHEAELNRIDHAVSDPSSSSYGNFLSPADFRARFSPTSARVAAVSNYLRTSGLRVTRVSDSRMLVDATGSTQAAERAFHTSLARYRVHGKLRRGASRPAKLPAKIGSGVSGIVGLNQVAYHHFSHPSAPPPPAFVNAPPCSNYWGEKFTSNAVPHAYGRAQPFAPCGYDAQDLQSAYGVDTALAAGIDGSGQTVGIVDAFAAPTIVEDVNEYSSRHGLPPANITQTIMPGTCHFGCHGAQGWYGEETLDLEAVHSMAPGANIAYYGAVDNSSKQLLDALGAAVDDNVDEVTNSYGSLGEQDTVASIHAQEDVAREAIAQGTGLYFSSGDNGDEHTYLGYVSADYPSSSPRVTSVGGTSLGVGPTGKRSFETGWGTKKSTLVKFGTPKAHWQPKPPGPFLYGSGGGTSRLFREPAYQNHVVPLKLATKFGSRNRVQPDLSMDGDPTTGMLVGETQTYLNGSVKYGEYRIGGTSLSSPLLAGYMADASQLHQSRLGFINPALYDLERNDSSAIRDVRSPRTQIAAVRNDYNNGVNGSDGTTLSLRSMNFDTSLHTTPGYDNVTGLGVPGSRGSLMEALAGSTFPTP